MKKNIAALVLAILGTIFGVIGAIIWAACADSCASIVGTSVGYTIGFVILGIGGGVLSLIGGIQAYTWKSARTGLSILGLILQVGALILQCVFVEGFVFVLSLWTLLSILMCLLATIFAARTPKE